VAAILILLGNISDISTQVTGAKDVAYKPIAASKNQETLADFVPSKIEIMMYKIVKPPAPPSIKGFLPTLSTSNIANKVKTKFIPPINTVCNN